MPDIISPISINFTNIVQSANKILFYFKGGGDVVCLKKWNDTGLCIYLPAFSNVRKDNVTDLIQSLEKEIYEEISLLNITTQNFLFDTHTKKIVSPDSFIDYLPLIGLRNAIFMVEDHNRRLSPVIMYPADDTPRGILQFASLITAKTDLQRPNATPPSTWSTPGKRLLTYLVHKRYALQGMDLVSGGCCSDNIIYNFPPNSPRRNVIKLMEGRTQAIDDIALSINNAIYGRYTKDSPALPDVQEVLLSDVIKNGVCSYYKEPTGVLLKVNIDISKEVFKKMTIETKTGIVSVELNPGVVLSTDEIEESLQAGQVIITPIVDEFVSTMEDLE